MLPLARKKQSLSTKYQNRWQNLSSTWNLGDILICKRQEHLSFPCSCYKILERIPCSANSWIFSISLMHNWFILQTANAVFGLQINVLLARHVFERDLCFAIVQRVLFIHWIRRYLVSMLSGFRYKYYVKVLVVTCTVCLISKSTQTVSMWFHDTDLYINVLLKSEFHRHGWNVTPSLHCGHFEIYSRKRLIESKILL
jgi:hypothetical protein